MFNASALLLDWDLNRLIFDKVKAYKNIVPIFWAILYMET